MSVFHIEAWVSRKKDRFGGFVTTYDGGMHYVADQYEHRKYKPHLIHLAPPQRAFARAAGRGS